LTNEIVDTAWRNYFGTSHGFAASEKVVSKNIQADPLEL
jgi:hypothetical protein